MKLKRIAIRDFRKLRDEIVIDGLGDGITILAGDNEEGKSTVLRAVQAGFFDRHTLMGDKLEAMQPYGSAGAAPSIDLAFSIGGDDCVLRKSFRPKHRAELSVGSKRVQGDEVEDRLAELLRFSPPGKGAAKADNRGIWSLFWIEQGTAFNALDVNDDTRKTLQGTFDGQLGKVLGGQRGVALVDAVQARLAEHFTPQGREKGPVRQLRQQLDETRAALAAARGKLQALDAQTQQLGTVEARIGERARADVAAQRAEAVKAALAQQAAIETLRQRAEKTATALSLAEKDAAAAAQRWSQRRAAVERAAQAAEALAGYDRDAEGKQLAFAAAAKRREAAQQRSRAAEAAADAAEQALADADAALERGRGAARLAALAERLQRAEGFHAVLLRAEAEQRAIAVDDAAKAGLDKLADKARKARDQFEGAAAAIVFRPAAGQQVRRDGAAIAPATPHIVTAAAEFALEGFGTVELRPGRSGDVGDLGDALDKAERALARELAALRVADLAAAAERHAQWTALGRTADAERGKLTGVAPDGIAALRGEVEAERARRGDAAAPPEDEAALVVRRDGARQERDARRLEFKAAQGELKLADAAFAGAETEKAKADTRRTAQREAADGAARTLDAERAASGDDVLQRQMADLAHAADLARDRHAADADAHSRANPEAAALVLENARAAQERLARDAQDDANRRLQLRAELQALGAQGFGEQAMQLEGEEARLAAALAAATREAAALRLLADTLDATQQEARETFTEPVRKRIRPYLGLVFPETDIGIDGETFDIAHLQRAAVPERFEALSLGTREQVAVLVRLAFAEYLAESGEPPVVILDDALVNSDERRMQRMLAALRKASKSLQIIVLTCRESDYAGLGAPLIRLADCRAGG